MAMRKTYCTASMEFVDVKALADSTPSTSDNQSIGNIDLLKVDADEIVTVADYATTELNLFTLDGSKTFVDSPTDIGFLSTAKSNDDCTFDSNPTIRIDFTENHTSAGITLYFGLDYPETVRLTWYTLAGTKIISTDFTPDALIYTCKAQITNYGRIDIEFVKTRFPRQYGSLQYVKYGVVLSWEKSIITEAKVLEEIDIISDKLSINTASISIMDTANDFDISNDDGAWKSVQKTQAVTLKEYVNEKEIAIGTFFVDSSSFKDNIASFDLIDTIGLMDEYTYYNGEIYEDKNVGELLEDIFESANVKYYSIDDDLKNLTVSGWLEVQTCREALQMVCFAIGAIADDSRSNTVKVYKPDRYVKATIEPARKFNGTCSIKLDTYVSGVSIGYKTYQLAEKTSNIFKGTLSKGTTKITFKNPYDVTTVTTTAGTITTLKTNYLIIESDEEQDCVITGTKYESTECSYEVSVDYVDAGETENVEEFSGCTLVNTELLPDIADYILKYFQLRKEVDLDYVVDTESVGNWVNIMTRDGYQNTSLIESHSIDLAGGYTASASCRGYSRVTSYDIFTGTELFAGEEGGLLI